MEGPKTNLILLFIIPMGMRKDFVSTVEALTTVEKESAMLSVQKFYDIFGKCIT